MSLYFGSVGLALRRPRTIPHLVRAAWAFRARTWWLRPPLERCLSWTTRMRQMRRPRGS